jgi:hypothetical protein
LARRGIIALRNVPERQLYAWVSENWPKLALETLNLPPHFANNSNGCVIGSGTGGRSHMDAQAKTIRKLQIELILISFALVFGAMAWTWQIGMAANNLDHRLDHATEDVKDLKQSIARLEAKHP